AQRTAARRARQGAAARRRREPAQLVRIGRLADGLPLSRACDSPLSGRSAAAAVAPRSRRPRRDRGGGRSARIVPPPDNQRPKALRHINGQESPEVVARPLQVCIASRLLGPDAPAGRNEYGVSAARRKQSVGSSVGTGTVKWFSDEKGFGFITPD